MDEKKIFYIIPRKNLFEIVLKSNLMENELLADINLILSITNYHKTMSISQLWSIKVSDDKYKVEIQIHVDKDDELDAILSHIKGMNYIQVEIMSD